MIIAAPLPKRSVGGSSKGHQAVHCSLFIDVDSTHPSLYETCQSRWQLVFLWFVAVSSPCCCSDSPGVFLILLTHHFVFLFTVCLFVCSALAAASELRCGFHLPSTHYLAFLFFFPPFGSCFISTHETNKPQM